MASALVLRGDAQNAWERSYAGEDSDASARPRLGWDSHGNGARTEASCLVALHSTGQNPRRGAHWLPFLSRRQFCRGQKSGSER